MVYTPYDFNVIWFRIFLRLYRGLVRVSAGLDRRPEVSPQLPERLQASLNSLAEMLFGYMLAAMMITLIIDPGLLDLWSVTPSSQFFPFNID